MYEPVADAAVESGSGPALVCVAGLEVASPRRSGSGLCRWARSRSRRVVPARHSTWDRSVRPPRLSAGLRPSSRSISPWRSTPIRAKSRIGIWHSSGSIRSGKDTGSAQPCCARGSGDATRKGCPPTSNPRSWKRAALPALRLPRHRHPGPAGGCTRCQDLWRRGDLRDAG
jgi:hypothetical protein